MDATGSSGRSGGTAIGFKVAQAGGGRITRVLNKDFFFVWFSLLAGRAAAVVTSESTTGSGQFPSVVQSMV
jgi:hypothetical protein